MISKEKSLLYTHPELVDEWHPSKMGHYCLAKLQPIVIKAYGGNVLRDMNGKPVIYKALTKQMVDEGFVFFQSVNGVWLTNNVPTKYLEKC